MAGDQIKRLELTFGGDNPPPDVALQVAADQSPFQAPITVHVCGADEPGGAGGNGASGSPAQAGSPASGGSSSAGSATAGSTATTPAGEPAGSGCSVSGPARGSLASAALLGLTVLFARRRRR